MSFVKDLWDGITGKTASKASKYAGNLQHQAAMEGIDLTRETRDKLLSLMRPYVDAGVATMPELQRMLTQPTDTSALDAAAQLAGFTRPKLETRKAPARQLRSGVPGMLGRAFRRSRPPAYRTLQTRRRIYSPIDRPFQDALNKNILSGRDTSALDALTGHALSGRDSSVLDQLTAKSLAGRDTSTLDELRSRGTAGRDTSALNELTSRSLTDRDTSALDQLTSQALSGRDTMALDELSARTLAGRDTSALNQLTSKALSGRDTSALDELATRTLAGRDTSSLDELTLRALSGRDTSALDELTSRSLAGRDTSALDQFTEKGLEGRDTRVLDQLTSETLTGRKTPALERLTALTTDPEAQRDFIFNNPFYGAMADEAQRRLLANRAARGKVGSGGTAEALQQSLVRMGSDLLAREVDQLRTADAAGASNYGSRLADLRCRSFRVGVVSIRFR